MTAIGADPAELDRPPDLGWIATDRGTCLLEHRSELGDLVGISAGDVPDVRVASDETQSRGARGSDPDRRGWLFGRRLGWVGVFLAWVAAACGGCPPPAPRPCDSPAPPLHTHP